MIKKFKYFLCPLILITVFLFSFFLSTKPTHAAAIPSCERNFDGVECIAADGQTHCFIAGRYYACKTKRTDESLQEKEVCLTHTYQRNILDKEQDEANKQKINNWCASLTQSEADKEEMPQEIQELIQQNSNDDDNNNGNNSGSGSGSGNVNASFTDENCDGTFLGLISWCKGVNIHDEASLKNGIWTIAANVATDITVIAAYLVLGFVIYGGYLYLLSGGDTTKVANGKKTIANAFIGLGIVLSANIILTAIRVILIGKDNAFASCYVDYGDCPNPTDMVSSAIQWVIGVAGLVSAIFIVIGGVSYMTSSGEPTKLEKAKKTILYAVIGLAIVALAEIITAFVTNIIKDASTQAYQITNQTTISKEVHVQKNS